MQPPKNKPKYPLIIAIVLVALCCLTLPLLLGVGITGLGFFTSPWILLFGIVIILVILWIAYQRRMK